MQRKFKTIDINDLIDADDINRTTKKGEIRNLYPAIHKKLVDGGWSARDMVAWLGERGIKISVELFRVYLRDIDKENGFQRSGKICHQVATESKSNINSKENNQDIRGIVSHEVSREKSGSVTSTGQINNPAVLNDLDCGLTRPAGLTDTGWMEMKAKARAEKRKQKFYTGS